MPGRVDSGLEVEQKTAFTALTGLCMLDSQSGYHPEGLCHVDNKLKKINIYGAGNCCGFLQGDLLNSW